MFGNETEISHVKHGPTVVHNLLSGQEIFWLEFLKKRARVSCNTKQES